MLDCEVVRTRGGAPAMHDRRTGETMHPVVGPLVEAQQVYVQPSRLVERLNEGHSLGPLVLLDAGLGAGSNALEAWRAAATNPGRAGARPLSIVSVDHSLQAFELAQSPAHAADFGFDSSMAAAGTALLQTHCARSGPNEWRFLLGDLLDRLAEQADGSVDVVFWDPFSALNCPELWMARVFRDLRRVCRKRATVHTFCTATPARSALLLAGFCVGDGAPTGHGRATTLAAVDPIDVPRPLGARFLSRLERSDAPFPLDVGPGALDQVRALAQFL